MQYGSFGPDLTGVETQSTEQQHFNLVWAGMDEGKQYFSRRQGNPQMPGFGVNRNTGKEAEGVPDLGPEGMLYGDFSMTRPEHAAEYQYPQKAFLRSRANSIEGGTTEVMLNILGERVLGLPGDVRVDRDVPWSQVPRN